MKIVICGVNSKYIHSSLAPWYLKAAAGGDVQIVETTINANPQEVAGWLIHATVLCFSTYIWNKAYIMKLIPIIKKQNPNIKLLMGGPEVSYNQQQVFSEIPDLDYIIAGEGEEPFRLFVMGKSVREIPGLSTKECIKEPFITCGEPPNPYTPEYLAALNGRIAYLETSRGCPFACSFCLSGRCGGVRYFAMERVKRDILTLGEAGAKTIKLVDRTFNSNNKRAGEILTFIKENYHRFSSSCFHLEIAGDIISTPLMEIMQAMPKGAIQVEIGLQSFNEETLKAVNRKTNMLSLTNNIKKLVKSQNMHVHIDLIAGLPKEGIKELEKSFDKAFFLYPNMLQLGFLKLLYGSPMQENPQGEFSKEPPYEVLSTKWLSTKDVKEVKRAEESLERMWNSGRFVDTIHYLLNKIDTSPFMLFCLLGKINGAKISLDEYTQAVFNLCAEYVDKDSLMDVMVRERIETNASGKLPRFLQRQSMGSLLKQLDKSEKTRRIKGVKRCAALLKNGKIIYADYNEKDELTNKYKLKGWSEND